MKGGEAGEDMPAVEGFEVSERVGGWLQGFGVCLGGLEQLIALGATRAGEQADDGPQRAEPGHLFRAVEARQPGPELIGGGDHRAAPRGIEPGVATISEPASRSAATRS